MDFKSYRRFDAFNECLVNAYYHPQPRDTKVKANLSLAFSLVGDKEN